MKISIIVAMDKNRLIGKDNRLPWHLPADLKHFKSITMGKPIIMGRNTHESIGSPLPGRTNIVVTDNREYTANGCVVVHSVEQALLAAQDADEVMVIGGARLYEQILPRADRIYLTLVDQEFDGDTWFPELDTETWVESDRCDYSADENNPHPYSFRTLDRRTNDP